jgi:hypothetical protein
MTLRDVRPSTWLVFAVVAALGCGGSKTPPPESPESPPTGVDEAAAVPDESAGAGTPGDGNGEPDESTPAHGDAHRHEDETRTTAVIADVIKANRDKARACYEKAAKDVPRLSGDVVIHFVLAPDGKVQHAELNEQRSTIHIPALTNCIIDVITSLPFPASSRGMETKVNYPFNFRP